MKNPVDSYADDTTVTAVGKSVDDIELMLTDDCNQICKWMKSNMLKMNPEKTHIMLMGTQKRLQNSEKFLEVVVVATD